MKRFYKTVSVEARDGGFAVLLDGKAVKTPQRKNLALPTRALAEAIAGEWRAQENEILRETMLLTRLANTAIDRSECERERIAAELIKYANGDLLCYRASEEELALRQREAWDPVLEWFAERYSAPLAVTVGMTHIAQPPVSLLALSQAIRSHDGHALTALHAATALTGSLVLGLALLDGRLDSEACFRLSWVDEAFQAEKWSEDRAAVARARTLAHELECAERFARLSRT